MTAIADHRMLAGALGLLIVGAAMGCTSPAPKMPCADVLLIHGNIHTVDEDLAPMPRRWRWTGFGFSPWATTPPSGTSTLCPGVTTVVDLEGRTVLPGLIDAHAHLHNLGLFLRRLDLVGTRLVRGGARSGPARSVSLTPCR